MDGETWGALQPCQLWHSRAAALGVVAPCRPTQAWVLLHHTALLLLPSRSLCGQRGSQPHRASSRGCEKRFLLTAWPPEERGA